MKGVSVILLSFTSILLAQDDVLHLQSGDAFKGKIEKIDPARVTFKVIIDGPSGRGESLHSSTLLSRKVRPGHHKASGIGIKPI